MVKNLNTEQQIVPIAIGTKRGEKMADPRRGGHDQRARNYLKFEATEPYQKQGLDEWFSTCTAYVAFDRRPVQSADVQFFDSGIRVHSARTDQYGRSVVEVGDLEPGPHIMSTQVTFRDGTVMERSETRRVPAPPKTKAVNPAKLVIDQHKVGNKYFFSFVVLSGDNSPVSGAIIRIIDQEIPQGCFDLAPTGANGTGTHQMEPTSTKTIIITVVGTAISTWRFLFKE